MTSTRQCLLAAVMVAVSVDAAAAIQWSFHSGGCDPDASSVGNRCTFEPIASSVPSGQNVSAAQVTAWANTGTGERLEQAIMKDWGSNGAGIQHANDEPTGSPQHAMDNEGNQEFMLFDFQGQDVQLKNMTLGWETDSDMTVLAYQGSGAPDLGATFVAGDGSDEDLTDNGWVSVAQITNADGYFDFSSRSNGITASYWIVASYAPAFGPCNMNVDSAGGCGVGSRDHVKLWDVGGNLFDPPIPPNSVSTPATALLLAGLLPLLGWRRR